MRTSNLALNIILSSAFPAVQIPVLRRLLFLPLQLPLLVSVEEERQAMPSSMHLES